MDKRRLLIVFALFFVVVSGTSLHAQTTDLATDFTYQGYLTKNGNAVTASCNFQFSLFDSLSGTTQIGATQTNNSVAVTKGAYSVQLDFGASAFNGQDRYLQIAVQCQGEAAFTTLSPRQPVFPAPYAGYALGVPWAGIAGVPAGFADGVDDTGASTGWLLTGNAGTTPGTNFLGTTDNVPLEFFVNNQRALRIERGEAGTWYGNNVIGGYSGNTVTTGVLGATVFGGGTDGSVNYHNSVTESFGTVSGGYDNLAADTAATIGGGYNNVASGQDATVGGGSMNSAYGDEATVSGGIHNTTNSDVATVSGGSYNTASGEYATVGGGNSNTASGEGAIVSGGSGNTANYEFATVGGGSSNNASGFYATVGGGVNNSITAAYGTIAGGGALTVDSAPSNLVSDNYGAIGGGRDNLAGDNAGTTADREYATVGGGHTNNASGYGSTISGGSDNTASGQLATISGGSGNAASGMYATVAGGNGNLAAGDFSFVVGRNAKNTNPDHDGVFLFADSTNANFGSIADDEFAARATGGVRFVVGSTTCTLTSGDTDWNCGTTSGQEFKSNFRTIDPRTVLDQIVNMPVQTWSYNGTDVRHMGPVAEDFYAAFGLGSSDHKIDFVDANGVNLAAIQGLYEIVQEKDAQISTLEARLGALERQNNTPLYGFVLLMSGVVAAGLYFGQRHRQRVA